MCNTDNKDGHKVGDVVYAKTAFAGHPFSNREPLRVESTGSDWVHVVGTAQNVGKDERWADLYNDAVTKARPVIAANGVGPGAGPGARLAATLRALGKKLRKS